MVASDKWQSAPAKRSTCRKTQWRRWSYHGKDWSKFRVAEALSVRWGRRGNEGAENGWRQTWPASWSWLWRLIFILREMGKHFKKKVMWKNVYIIKVPLVLIWPYVSILSLCSCMHYHNWWTMISLRVILGLSLHCFPHCLCSLHTTPCTGHVRTQALPVSSQPVRQCVCSFASLLLPHEEKWVTSQRPGLPSTLFPAFGCRVSVLAGDGPAHRALCHPVCLCHPQMWLHHLCPASGRGSDMALQVLLQGSHLWLLLCVWVPSPYWLCLGPSLKYCH